MTKIYFLTGQIGSGKTTALLKDIKGKPSIDGVLTLNTEGKRILHFIRTQEELPLDAQKGEDFVSIGKYRFSVNAFRLVNNYLKNIDPKITNTIIVDEIGPLELNGEGFNEGVEVLLNHKNIDLNLVFVVRNSLYNEVLNKYHMNAFPIVRIKKEELKKII